MTISTLDQLRREFDSPAPRLAQVMAAYFPHITSEDYMLRLIRSGDIKLRVVKHHRTAKAPWRVYLTDLAAYLEAKDPSNTTAAHQAA